MGFVFRELQAQSPFIQRFWMTRSGPAHQFTSTAVTSSELVFTFQNGKVQVALRGPETQASLAPVPGHATFVGVQFSLGTYLAPLPPTALVNGGIELPLASARAFWLNGSAIPIPNEDELETFVARLIRRGELQQERTVQHVLNGTLGPQSARSTQRQFLYATGISHRQVQQIERASTAVEHLLAGEHIADVVAACGYSDQPHLTRALRRYWGQTLAQLRRVVYVQDSAQAPD